MLAAIPPVVRVMPVSVKYRFIRTAHGERLLNNYSNGDCETQVSVTKGKRSVPDGYSARCSASAGSDVKHP